MYEDVGKLKLLKAEEAAAFARNDYFAVNDARQRIISVERQYHERLDSERAAQWGRMPPHP